MLHILRGTTSLDKTLAVLKECIGSAESAYEHAKNEPDRRSSDLHRGKADKVMLYLANEQQLKRAMEAHDKAKRIVETAVK